MAPWKSAEFKPVFASFILLLNPSKTLRNPSFTHLGHLLPLAQGKLHFSLRNTETQLLLSHSMILLNWLEETKKPRGKKKPKRCSFYQNMTAWYIDITNEADVPLWLLRCGAN